ncbi:DUF1697 domain-containing protein [Clostridium lacusfryxellense]|uniref:DUF1697 domain-containing protein n=1 Tax=Clostridium lacusfryxellense TaxID=205328 RepID=UPI001C0AE5BD|nr:DUF1697 domain-containing protein [Clostridium lacusfryxellense]MBU3114184.1 DUF1697 domain-containing protein [Clostridium lacusfryxellense]
MRYVVLLRGINVAGKNRIKMIDLKNIFESLKFKNVKTYIQSGNVVFDYDITDIVKLTRVIEVKINDTFGFFVKVIVRNEEEFRSIVNNNPFVNDTNVELDKLHVVIMSDIPDPKLLLNLDIKKEDNEKFLINKKEIYLYCPNGYGKTKLNNTMFEKILNMVCTTRKWKTIKNIARDI